MKAMHGTATATVDVAMERCIALLAAIDRYPDWYPEVVREVKVLEWGEDGGARRARAKLHVSHGPLVKDFDLLLALSVEPSGAVALTRVPDGAFDREEFAVCWWLAAKGRDTRIELTLDALLSVPRLVPLGGIGDTLANGFVSAAVRALTPG
jgi:hypothetical protein